VPFIALCSSSAHKLLDLLSVQVSVMSSVLPVDLTVPPHTFRALSPSVMLRPGVGTGKVRSQLGGVKRSRNAQNAREHPTPLRQFEARQAGMQVRAPARLPRLGVGHDAVPGHH